MSEQVRRSSRRTIKKPSTYNVGDIVEVTRNDELVKGRLVYNLTAQGIPSANPRWLVAFDDESTWKDEELYEKAFGKHFEEAMPVTESTSKRSRSDSTTNTAPKSKKPKHGTTTGSGASAGKTSSSSETDENIYKKKHVTFSANTSPTASDTDSKKNGASAREQRSLRRQATAPDENSVIVTTATTKRVDHNKRADRKRHNKQLDEDVVKVQMLTGILYLYRGPVRRVEFVRRF